MYSYNWLFSWQNSNLQGKYSTGLLFTAEILQEANALYFPLPEHGPKHLQNLTPKCKILNMFWTLIANKRRTEQLNFCNWLSDVKNLVLSNGSEYVRNAGHGIEWKWNGAEISVWNMEDARMEWN